MNWHCYSCDKDAKSRDELSDCLQNGHQVMIVLDKKGLKKALKGSRDTKQTIKKIKGKVDNLYVESIIVDGKPYFLCKSLEDQTIFLRELIETEDRILKPLEPTECGYYPYSFTTAEIEGLINNEFSKEELLDEIKVKTDRYVSINDLGKNLIVGDILLTYCQERISTLHFPFFVGETESGKSSALHLAKWLCYRCHFGEDIPMADVYNYLGFDEEGCGTIVEDEAQELWRSSEKLRMYKSSYSKGSKKARILGVDSLHKHQVFYNTFCPKWFAGERIPQDKGFCERLAIVHMTEGQPQSNIKRLSNDEVNQLIQLRNCILVWKVQNISKGLDKIDSGLKQRDQELWEDFLSISYGTKYFDRFKEVVKHYTEQRHNAIKNSLEAKLFKFVISKLDSNLEIKFEEYWNYLTMNNPQFAGNLDERSTRTFYAEEYPEKITQHLIAKIFDNKFQASKETKVTRDQDKIQHQTTTYKFDKEIALTLSKKYGIEVPIDSPLYLGQHSQIGQQTDDFVNPVDQDSNASSATTGEGERLGI